MPKLPHSFYQNEVVTDLAVLLLGKQLFTRVDGQLTGGTIVETEAYDGLMDKASHAYGGRFTNRTRVMYEQGGVSYVYLCYGIHHLFNVVSGVEGSPQAVLIRGIEPIVGIDVMLKRRNMSALKPNVGAGPGALAKSLGIDMKLNAKDLLGDEIWIEDNGIQYTPEQLIAGPRIGVAYAGDHALLPWRYAVNGNKYVSKPHIK
ncbi:DNA-3-methyladenine glycosylase [Pedobacter sp.]|uniref:DNA-3-methyladenine glycosylase n=1 Tax=Pedobacter sp. TaxID=1411316 RepID=UPI003D7F9FAC